MSLSRYGISNFNLFIEFFYLMIITPVEMGDADISSCVCLSPVPRGPYSEKRERGRNASEKKRVGMIGCNGGSNAVDSGPVWALRRAQEEGREGRRTSAIEIFSRSLGRGSWPRRVRLAPSVDPRRPGKSPLGPSNPCGRIREHDGKKSKKKGGKKGERERERTRRKTKSVAAGPMRTNWRELLEPSRCGRCIRRGFVKGEKAGGFRGGIVRSERGVSSVERGAQEPEERRNEVHRLTSFFRRTGPECVPHSIGSSRSRACIFVRSREIQSELIRYCCTSQILSVADVKTMGSC